MDNQDRQAIDGLFQRLAEAERQAGPRDGEADAFIRERIATQPGAPYYMAQTIVMQSYALEEAQARIEALEQQAAAVTAAPQRSGGLFGGLFGGGAAAAAPAASRSVPSIGGGRMGAAPTAQPGMNQPGPNSPGVSQVPPGAPGSPWGNQAGAQAAQAQQGRQGGGFLAGAAQTAMGVAGGLLLGNMIGSMFAGDEANAAEANPAPPTEAAPEEDVAAEDEGGGFFDGLFGGDEEF